MGSFLRHRPAFAELCSRFSCLSHQVIAGPSAGVELSLFVAEFSLLNTQLYSVEAECQDGDCLLVNDEGPSAVDLEVLSREIPDLRTRLGIGDGLVFGGGGFSMRRARMAVSESFAKITEGVVFLVTGLRMLGSDVKSSAMIFLRAAQGGTLKPREVQALRRTVLDFLTFIPFAIILIIPLTPVGHVLIFGFIQKYFPGLYPSQFTQRRQEIMKRCGRRNSRAPPVVLPFTPPPHSRSSSPFPSPPFSVSILKRCSSVPLRN